MDKALEDLRQILIGSQVRISNLALSLHKEQERVSDIIKIIDGLLIKD